MRVEPSKKSLEAYQSESEKRELLKLKINKITRIIAIVVAFLSTFAFFFKILFF
jgi:hypothetical protein